MCKSLSVARSRIKPPIGLIVDMSAVNIPMVRWDDFKVFNDTLDTGILQHSPEGLSTDVLKV